MMITYNTDDDKKDKPKKNNDYNYDDNYNLHDNGNKIR